VARAYSQDLRERVIAATEAGMPARHAAVRFGIGLATAIVWARRARETGERTARRQGQPRRSMLDAHGDYLEQLIAATCDITLAEMQAKLLEERGVKCSIGTLWKCLDQRKLTVKKSRRTPRNRTART
jgi:transposase